MTWAPTAILAAMVAVWIAAFVRRSNRLNWAVALLGLALVAMDLAGLRP